MESLVKRSPPRRKSRIRYSFPSVWKAVEERERVWQRSRPPRSPGVDTVPRAHWPRSTVRSARWGASETGWNRGRQRAGAALGDSEWR